MKLDNNIKQYSDGSIGHYLCGCFWCEESFIGHKRDTLCNECEDNHCAITKRISDDRVKKIFNTGEWKFIRQEWKIGFVCSSFDLLHAGHLIMLKDAKSVCDYLVVGLQIDPSVDRTYKNSPIFSLDERYEILQAIKYITDFFVYETNDDLLRLMTVLKPDIRILGSDWKEKEDEIIGKDISPIYWHDRSIHTYSTTALRNKIFMAERAKKFSEDSK